MVQQKRDTRLFVAFRYPLSVFGYWLLVIRYLRNMICSVVQSFEIFFVLQVKQNGVFLQESLRGNQLHDLMLGKRAIVNKHLLDDVLCRTREKSMLGQTIHTATYKDKSSILDQFIMDRLCIHRLFIEPDRIDRSGDIAEVHRLAMLAQDKICLCARGLR